MGKASLRGANNTGNVPPIVGRSAERVLLREQMLAARNGRGQFCILSGEAGIGKTTLVSEMVAEAQAHGMHVLEGQCYDLAATPPYGLWLDLAASYRGNGNPVPLPDVLSRERAHDITSQADEFERVRAFLAEVAAATPTLVVLEDVHWADPVSLELVRYVSTHVRELPLCIVITYRVDELTTRNPLYRRLPALVRESGGLRVDLGRLDRDDLVTLVEGRYALGEDDRARLVSFLADHSDGNPFFAIELLRALEHRGQDGGLWRDGNYWTLGELAELVVPSLVRQVIDIRLDRLGPDVKDPLALAAVIGQAVPLVLWQRLAGLDEEAMLRLVETAVEWHVVVASTDGTRMHFVHALTREALYEGVVPPRRRLLHREVAEALMALPDVDPDPVAYHLQRAGDPRTADWMIRAGERAQRVYAWLTAWERFSAAAEALANLPGEELLRSRVLYRCGRLLRYADARRGIEDLRLARRLADAAGDAVLAGESTYSQGLLQTFADDWTHGIADMAEGIARIEALPPEQAVESWSTIAWIADALPSIGGMTASGIDTAAERMARQGVSHRRGGLPWFYAASGRLGQAIEIGDGFLALAGSSGWGPLVHSATGHATFGLATARAALGDPDGAREAFREARDIYRQIDHHAVIAFTYITELLDVALRYGVTDIEERERLAREAQAALERGGGALPPDLPFRRAFLPLLWIEGRWDEAERIAAEGTTHGTYVARRPLTAAMAPILAHKGRVHEAWSLVREVLPAGPNAEPGSAVLMDGLMLQALAIDLALDAGDVAAARAWLGANARWLDWSGAIAGRVEHEVATAQVCQAAGDAETALEHARRAVALSAEPFQPLVRIGALRLLGEITGAREPLDEALTLAERCGAPFERARTLVTMAEAIGDRSGVGEATRIATRLGAEPLLARVGALRAGSGRVEDLTTRELEVLRLASEGLTDAEIGERLFISHRTVAQHLRSVYGKLEVHSRAAATRYAMERQIV